MREITSTGALIWGYAGVARLVCLLFGLLALHVLAPDRSRPSRAAAGPLIGVAGVALLLPVWASSCWPVRSWATRT